MRSTYMISCADSFGNPRGISKDEPPFQPVFGVRADSRVVHYTVSLGPGWDPTIYKMVNYTP